MQHHFLPIFRTYGTTIPVVTYATNILYLRHISASILNLPNIGGVIGVHTPEFAFEKETGNVQTAIERLGIHYPVAQDNDYATWKAYKNQYWPAEYLIDQKGKIVYEYFGEGKYDHTENAIRKLLGLSMPVAADNGKNLSRIHSPEIYFNLRRLKYLTPEQSPSEHSKEYSISQSIPLNNFTLVVNGNLLMMMPN